MTPLDIVKELVEEVPEPGAEAYPAPGEADAEKKAKMARK